MYMELQLKLLSTHMDFLSEDLKNNILVKREDLQPIFSFKIRGAYNKISKLSDKDQKKWE